jgi:hypothetical protein
MDGGDLIIAFEAERNERIGVLDAINEVGTALYHALVDKLLERFFLYGNAEVEEELVPEAAVDEMAGGVFRAADVEVDVLPVAGGLWGEQRAAVVRVHVAEEVG